VVIAGQQQATRDWWNEHRPKYEVFVSDLVAVECRRGDPVAAQEREEVLGTCSMLDIPETAQQLAQRILASRLMPARATADALHVAIAADLELSAYC
jgi:predicted nucleic acid-binding protein